MLFRRKKQAVVSDIPETTDEVPVVPYRVLYVELPFYMDPECTREVTDARIVVLEAQDPSDPPLEKDVVPSRKRYQVGQMVTWSLNNKKSWEEAWYRNPETGRIERAWTMHVEFIGEVIDPAAFAGESGSHELRRGEAGKHSPAG